MPQLAISEPAEAILDSLVQALDLVSVGILMLNRDLCVRFSNRRMAELFRIPPALLEGSPLYRDLLDRAAAHGWLDVPNAEIADYIDERERAVREGSIPPTQIRFRNGMRVLFSCVPCDDGGRILTYADISQELQREVSDAVERVRADLRFQNETLEDQAAYLASLAEATDESAQNVEIARLGLEEKIVEHRRLEDELRRLATTDGLTGALNRSAFFAEVQQRLDRGQELAILMLDIDHFKSVNDRYGHAGGDVALRHLVDILSLEKREGDLLGRLGGEEFGILIPVISPQGATAVAERMRRRVAAQALTFGDRLIEVTVSIGVATRRQTDCKVEQIMARADAALYQAKGEGRNRVVTEPALAA